MIDILYVEDNLDEVDIFKRAIGRQANPPSFSILANGSEAIDYLLQQGTYLGKGVLLPRIILIDLNLPGRSGFDVIQQARAQSRTRYTPIIVYSSSENPVDIRRAYDLGVNAYLIKPGSYHKVTDMMQKAVEFWLTQNKNAP
ncbi:response regulator [Fibrella aquatica]|jgi:CheY-like chemotaxis protein|uniref:response regulator n=1 Tax=Fibrella aquatica TaxID=3242487 RepID=UPI003522B95F